MNARLALGHVDRVGARGDAPVSGEDSAPTFKGAIGRQAVRVRNGGRRLFSAAGIGTPRGMPRGDRNLPALHCEAK
jgi:hypothetical protein